MTRFNVRIDSEDLSALKEYAQKHKTETAEVIRMSIRLFLNQLEAEEAPKPGLPDWSL